MKRLFIPLKKEDIRQLKVGEKVLLSGTIYTARDQAHYRLVDLLKQRKKMPIDLTGSAIYYCGPTPTPSSKVIGTSTTLSTDGERRPSILLRPSPESIEGRSRTIGACGPTTSARMDKFTPQLLKAGLKAMIGKGRRAPEVKQAIKKYQAVYFLTYAGCAALLSEYVKKAKVFAFKDLGPEAIYKLEVKDFPLIVGIDAEGKDIYASR